MAVKAQPAPISSWTGLYGGVNGGGAFGNSTGTLSTFTTAPAPGADFTGAVNAVEHHEISARNITADSAAPRLDTTGRPAIGCSALRPISRAPTSATPRPRISLAAAVSGRVFRPVAIISIGSARCAGAPVSPSTRCCFSERPVSPMAACNHPRPISYAGSSRRLHRNHQRHPGRLGRGRRRGMGLRPRLERERRISACRSRQLKRDDRGSRPFPRARPRPIASTMRSTPSALA